MLSDWFFLVDLHRERQRDLLRWAETERLRRNARRPVSKNPEDSAETAATKERLRSLNGLNAALSL